ncbi:hypothetical protein TU87_01755 [Pseudomonas weihenstephanensis]|nr:hypothetical protein TU87_01755 [Pseudomonas weihenstephanensis]
MDAYSSLLIDCGLFQGGEKSLGSGGEEHTPAITFELGDVKALVVTHVHADHIGRIPYLLAAGFKGPIFCSEPSAKLLPLVLEDAFKLDFSRDESKVDRYVKRVQEQIIALPFNQWFVIEQSDGLLARIRLQKAGHILGSAYVECDLTYPQLNVNRRIVFSGDLGASNAPLLAAPVPPEKADVLVLESTYGNRLHEDRSTRQARLESAIDKALADHGTLLIPAFSLGRTQELLYEIEDILHRKSLLAQLSGEADVDRTLPVNWPELPIILDSPLASRLTDEYQKLERFWADGAQQRLKGGRKPLRFSQLITIDSHKKHLQTVNYLKSTGRPAIVIAANGMCSNGRIVNYLKAMLENPRHNVLFIGYQAKGTPGAAIQKFGPRGGYVELEGERCIIRAGVTSIGGYSAHADQQDLLHFVSRIGQWPEEIRLVHGEIPAKEALAIELQALYRTQSLPVNLLIPSG